MRHFDARAASRVQEVSGMKSIVSMLRSLVRSATDLFDRPETANDQTMSKFIGLL